MRALTQVGDARVLGLHLVGGTQGGADLGDERLWELLAVELLRHRHRSVSGEEAGRHPWITTEPDVACDGGGACGPGESDDGHLQARYHASGVAERDVLRPAGCAARDDHGRAARGGRILNSN